MVWVINAFLFQGPGLWVMPESDRYTTIMREWLYVKEQIALIKQAVMSNLMQWQAHHMTDPAWRPSMGEVIDQQLKPTHRALWKAGWNANRGRIPGTSPSDCEQEYAIFLLTGYATDDLHRAAVGTFRLMVTADTIDLDRRHVVLNVWMYNRMSGFSFGRFSRYWPFSSMTRSSQFMWWNWKERFNFDESGKILSSYRGNLAF